MKKQLLTLALALAMCLSLTVPAMASIETGPGWTYDTDTNTMTLNGVQNETFDLSNFDDIPPTIVLAPGSKNTLTSLYVDADIDDGKILGLVNVTIKGTGELVIYNTDRELYGESSVFLGDYTLTLQDGLTMTGGTKPGDSTPVTVQPYSRPELTWSNGISYRCMAGNTPATYIRIAPGSTSTPAAPASTSTGFTDVAANSPFAQAISWAVEQGITKGITNTTFGPGNTCTVSHILTFLWRAAGQPGDSVTDWAAQQGINAKDMSAPCTRSMAVEFMWKAAGQPQASKTASFTDVSASAAYARAVNWAVEKGITSGTSANAFSPNNNCTRGQIVTFLYRASK